jgi:hypothetical protein
LNFAWKVPFEDRFDVFDKEMAPRRQLNRSTNGLTAYTYV